MQLNDLEVAIARLSDNDRSTLETLVAGELDQPWRPSLMMLAGKGAFNKVERHWALGNGVSLKFGGMKDADDWRDYAGRARDYIGFDEAAEFLEE